MEVIGRVAKEVTPSDTRCWRRRLVVVSEVRDGDQDGRDLATVVVATVSVTTTTMTTTARLLGQALHMHMCNVPQCR
jgi:hypothetical protein